MREALSRDLPLGYTGYGPPSGTLAVFKKARQGAAIDSSIFETSTPISTARCCTRLTELQCLLCQAMSSDDALYMARRNGGLSFHISPVTQFCLPNPLAKQFPCAKKTRPPTPRSVSATRNPRSAAQIVLSTAREIRSTPSKRESISMVTCVEEDRVQTRPGQTRSKSRSRRCRK